ncbi:uncharacterized protein LOC131264338 [Anopheles coustani]|uniref:uncharacterized protein LOC131264338 n=1 Tax=Anopheles coustani TaxID=139045 RepID=UPI0026598B20|nr:uncharacterized protein LOC131264338 [Anopheles coustani]XP_058122624.1 uncharacterized protein LOC131264338 [Anopheles coustani]XP_058122625.1 uncharacterized protein LOC131264338 [Anopheles coustani]
MSLCDLSKSIEVHASIVGVLLTLACIGSLGGSYHNEHETSTGVATFLVALAWVILYWYGFLKRNPLCILISMVFLAFAVIGTIAVFVVGVVVVITIHWSGVFFILFALICNAFEVYYWHVMSQLRESFLNDSMPNAGTVKNLPV